MRVAEIKVAYFNSQSQPLRVIVSGAGIAPNLNSQVQTCEGLVLVEYMRIFVRKFKEKNKRKRIVRYRALLVTQGFL